MNGSNISAKDHPNDSSRETISKPEVGMRVDEKEKDLSEIQYSSTPEIGPSEPKTIP